MRGSGNVVIEWFVGNREDLCSTKVSGLTRFNERLAGLISLDGEMGGESR